jgi:FkbM family methyltransferase
MTYRIPLPAGGRLPTLDIVEPNSTAVQRSLRRNGLAAYEPPTLTTLLTLFDDQNDGFTFFDVGANMGLYALICASMFSPGAVDAFEPTPTTVAVLRKVVDANRLAINVIEAAAGDVNGRAVLHLSAKSDSSNSMVAGFKESSGAVEVETIRIDDHVAATGRTPNVMKIDVETFEPAVLAGAARSIERHRPFIVLEVLNRRGRDHGVEITQAMARFGYSYYELSASPVWDERVAVEGATGSPHNDWLLAPAPLDEQFGQRWRSWSARLEECGVDRNSHVPIALSVRAAMRRGGVGEVIATARRYGAELRRKRARRTR